MKQIGTCSCPQELFVQLIDSKRIVKNCDKIARLFKIDEECYSSECDNGHSHFFGKSYVDSFSILI